MPYPSSPVYDDLFHRKALVALDFIVVGGGVAGLTAAYNLKQAGHNVHVLERADGVGKGIGGLRVPPNMTRLLLQWGLEEKLNQTAVKCPRVDFFAGKTGEYMSSIVYHEELMKELQADAYAIHHADLQKMIYDHAVASGVKVTFGVNVVDADLSEPSVLLSTGEKLRADMIIGADGVTSIVRRKLIGESQELRIGPCTGYNFTVSVKAMKNDPLLRPLTEDGAWLLWMGSRRCVLTFMVSPDEYAIQLIWPDDKAALGWEKVVPVSKFDFSMFEERVQRLMKLASDAMESQHTIFDPLDAWCDESGHALIIGDAAHPLNPGTSHAASMAVEDGAVLGSLFSRLRTREPHEVQRLLNAFQEIRQGRCEYIVRTEMERVMFGLLEEDDPNRAARDAGLVEARKRQKLDFSSMADSYLGHQFEDFKDSYLYEAYDAADDWWVDWGVIGERMAASTTCGICIPVTSVQDQPWTVGSVASL